MRTIKAQIEEILDVLREQEVRFFEDTLDDFADYFDLKTTEIIQNFKENYSGPYLDDTITGLDGREMVNYLKNEAKLNNTAIAALIRANSFVTTKSYYVSGIEVWSGQLGEQEFEVCREDSPELFELLDKADLETQLYYKFATGEDSILTYFYLNDRIVLELDVDEFISAVCEL